MNVSSIARGVSWFFDSFEAFAQLKNFAVCWQKDICDNLTTSENTEGNPN